MAKKKEIESQDNYDVLVEQEVIKRIGHISSELAHDLRGPLQIIQNAIYLIQKNPENQMLYGMVTQSISQATDLLERFRDYYKAHDLTFIETEPSKVIDLAFSVLTIPDNIKIIKQLPKLPPRRLDPTKLALAIRNLIKNAVEAMPKGGTMTIKTYEEKDTIVFIIEDNGVGISPEIARIIYAPFFAKMKHGKGLGVPTSKRIIESHNGELTFKTTLGEGTTFTIRIPRSR
jgi:two-component system, sporulation sensor kinase E